MVHPKTCTVFSMKMIGSSADNAESTIILAKALIVYLSQ